MKTFLFALLLALSGIIYNQFAVDQEITGPAISRVHWITLPVKAPEVFDRLYHLFVKELKIPVFFEPETYGTKRYTGIYAGNVILEPCGPFPLEQVNGEEIHARYNTLIFCPYVNARTSAEKLEKLGFDYTSQPNSSLINITVKELCTGRLPVHLSDSCNLRPEPGERIDSLRNALREIEGGPLGFIYIEEVHIGYKTQAYLNQWEKFLDPLKSEDDLWYLPEKPNLRFLSSEREEILALVCRVESLEKAKNYLQNANMLGTESAGRIELNLEKTYGLKIILVE